jgi:hypothetical protein
MGRGTAVAIAALSLCVAAPVALAQSSESVEPYFLIMVDTSGSMGTGFSTVENSCGMATSRLNAAKCVLRDVLNSYPEADYGLGRFEMQCGTNDSETVYRSFCPGTPIANAGEILVPISSDNLSQLISFVNFAPVYTDLSGLACPDADPPEILVNDHGSGNTGGTPLEGTLRGALRYYQGNDPDFPTSPIATDPFLGCRDYFVLLLTDGVEQCGGDPAAAATALRSTNVPGVGNVDIRTYVIGFGVADGDDNIEEIATAGGTTALFAQDEDSLKEAFGQIIQDSLVQEVCNNLDDDCDGFFDEGFQKYCDVEGGDPTPPTIEEPGGLCVDPGDDCDDSDDNCYLGTTDEPRNDCGFCGPNPDEVCNNLDDDCDDNTDEGNVCDGCTFMGAEVCNNEDEDCDGDIDEGLTRPCGTDVGRCTAGEEECVAGEWENCDATGPFNETCNGLDDNCDGNIDGFSRPCTDNPDPIPPANDGICQPGIQICPSDGSGDWGECLGDVGPGIEACDNEDDDCDGDTDEDTGGADCSTDCGIGETVCVNGVLECQGTTDPQPEVCNNFDDDCDDTVDEEVPNGGPCDEDGTLCVPGELVCVAGEMQCVGGEEPLPEICDCIDNDCDEETDEEPPAICPPGSQCVNCQCATPCGGDEFPCPTGQICQENFCVVDPCYQVDCPPTAGGPQECLEGECVPICDTVECQVGLACHPSDGSCRTDDCIGFPDRCDDDEFCVGGVCQPDPCAGVSCPDEDQYCFDGDCVGSCAAVNCPDGEKCQLGVCVADLCAEANCGEDRVCDPATGDCVEDECQTACRQGEVCDPLTGECERDPCLGVDCPGAQICHQGSCFNRSDIGPDGGPVDHEHVFAGGGGCSAGGAGSGLAAAMVVLLLLLLLLGRRRAAAGLLVLALAPLASGCQADGYCITCTVDGDGGPGGGGDGGEGDGDGGPLTDGGPAPDACALSGLEQCDDLDNDCDGTTDEGDLPGEGVDCGSETGECQPGTTTCVGGDIVCGEGAVLPVQESCDTLDNDCDGTTDEGSPGAGLICGTNLGECTAGVTACEGGEIVCNGDIGGSPETCDGEDDDCDGAFDEGIPTGGDCGPASDQGLCEFGTLTCLGGQMQCLDAVFPQVEECDAVDQDCDGDPTNGFDLDNDSQNCGECGTVCQADNAIAVCDGAGECMIAACLPGWVDLPPFDYDDGCEYQCSFQGSEVCNGADDDCDNAVDEDLVTPDVCDPDGACAGTSPECDPVADAWVCDYGPDVEVDGDGVIVPETRCDGLDNDCDGATDEPFEPLLGSECDDGELGECRDPGNYVCNGTGEGVVCDAVDAGDDEGVETCNALDDDCDGQTDEGDLSEWVDIGTAEIFAYEASRPDASATGAGGNEDYPCSKPAALPWTNITYPEAVDACEAIGARLCSEEEWQLACELDPAGGAVVQDDGPDGLAFVEAEDFTTNVADPEGDGDVWIFASSVTGFSGTGYMFASPDNDGGDDTPPDGPRLNFTIDFSHTGTHYLWLRGYGAATPDDEVWAGLSAGTAARMLWWPQDTWMWQNINTSDQRVAINVPTTGNRTVSVWMRNDGFRFDKLLITSNPEYIPTGDGPSGQCTWSYGDECRTYDGDTCNGDDYDTVPGGQDNDGPIPTGELDMCYADWGPAGQVHDLSGNVREWAEARADEENPIRGGSYNSARGGLRCDHDFLIADDDFSFPSVGFRCCR